MITLVVRVSDRGASMDGPPNQFDVLGIVEVVGRTQVGCSVGVEHDDITRFEVPCLGRELDVVEHPEKGAGTADRNGGVASPSTWMGNG